MTKAARKTAKAAVLTGAPIDSWLWKRVVRDPNSESIDNRATAGGEDVVVVGKEVGVGEVWSHLNKRRGKARLKKVASDLSLLKERARNV